MNSKAKNAISLFAITALLTILCGAGAEINPADDWFDAFAFIGFWGTLVSFVAAIYAIFDKDMNGEGDETSEG
jgi:hypothetical protein